MRTISRLFKSLRGRSGRQLIKLLVYSAVCLAVLAGVARIGNVDFFADDTAYAAAMPDVSGLQVNDAVKVAGVDVGKVTSLSVERGRAVVRFKIDPDVRLTDQTRVGVRWRNVLGQKYLYLYPQPDGRRLEPGDRLPASNAVESADVGAFLNSIGPILQAIDPAKANAFIRAFNEALEGNEDKVRSLLSDTGDIATDLGGADVEIGSLIGHLDTVVGGLADRDEDLQLVISRFETMAGGLADNNADLQLLVERFAAVQAKLDDLVTRNRGNLDATIDDLATIAEVLGRHRDDLDEALATLPEGLAIYDKISSYGQWFQIRTKITCLANQRTCSDEAITSSALDSGISPEGAASVVGFALEGAQL
ncbi:MCE family protein [Aquihabitans daechungensis]|uniref:MCE family protein n=1 Tax=Aquihabitans daechungensis TaxID=1052257 RepID=UPI003BA03750